MWLRRKISVHPVTMLVCRTAPGVVKWLWTIPKISGRSGSANMVTITLCLLLVRMKVLLGRRVRRWKKRWQCLAPFRPVCLSMAHSLLIGPCGSSACKKMIVLFIAVRLVRKQEWAKLKIRVIRLVLETIVLVWTLLLLPIRVMTSGVKWCLLKVSLMRQVWCLWQKMALSTLSVIIGLKLLSRVLSVAVSCVV